MKQNKFIAELQLEAERQSLLEKNQILPTNISELARPFIKKLYKAMMTLAFITSLLRIIFIG
ncbi:MAG: hypothetical protein COU63_03710 [Candidatus Pacebacteria bacterium CG10_big_fil_rev_8_21_14_0_10_36_11]|nr:hypothetical protein [Candidatus Pacearchaeota archaeon]OIP73868.1 MAG: hypothetical protein AUK08_04920 [Candidatus Pacebacteria bacterium CG2_30_36_39]PIR64568.1 MAG: hypothetical protein COU63_03710 [Candidatus Pacebacteria bacterium CG10_big_fil_rev_8_21_14_0_10_36_11]PJC42991.1 MAG: hypothetical protein CO040_01470 [Candidatus Pacebacteria bacterium CG_4_9_14_0_2_um_filter_36_8]